MDSPIQRTGTATLLAGQRLCLAEFPHCQPNANCAQIISGHGSHVEFYTSDSAQELKFEVSIDVFPTTKTTVHGVVPRSDGKAFFCFGAREFTLFTSDFIEPSGASNPTPKLKRHCNFHFSEWISAAKWLGQCQQIVLHFATNTIKLFSLNPPRLEEMKLREELKLQLECRAIATSSLFDGESWEQLRVFVGTCLGPVHLFAPAQNGGRIVRTFHGNNGMPFAIRSCQNWVFTVGDDRSLRVWEQTDGKQLFEKYGHGARPYALEICSPPKLVFTAGVDGYCCVWRWTENGNGQMLDLQLQRRVDLCDAAFGTVRALLPRWHQTRKEIVHLIVGSERGALAAFSFNHLETTDCAKMDGENVVLDIGKVLAFAFIDCSSEANEGEEKSVMLFTLDGKRRLQIHQFGPADQQPTLLTALSARVNEELLLQTRLTELRADLFASSQHCGALAFCSHKALFVLKVLQNDDGSFNFISDKLEGKFAQIHWVQPQQCCLLLAVEEGREASLCELILNNGRQQCLLLLKKVAAFVLGPPNNPLNAVAHIQSTLFIREANVLLLGTRSGAILVFSIDRQKAKCIFVSREAHGPNTVTSLRVVTLCLEVNQTRKGFAAEIHSLGRDGTQRKWRLSLPLTADGEVDGDPKSSWLLANHRHRMLDLLSAHRLPFEWPCSFLPSATAQQHIAGFQSDDFVLFDATANLVISRRRCGGGNRHWQLLQGQVNKAQDFRLAFTQKGLLHLAPLPSPLCLNLIKPALHSENIVTLASKSADNNPQSTLLILSGSLDRRICLSTLRLPIDSNSFELKCSIQMHLSNVETICLIDEEEEGNEGKSSLALSGGGRSELICWRLDTTNDDEPRLEFIFEAQLSNLSANTATTADQQKLQQHNRENEEDTRLMALCPVNSHFVLVLCSDGTIRLVQLHFSTRSVIECTRLQIRSLAMFSAIQFAVVHRLIFAISTAGELHIFRLSLSPNPEITKLQEPFPVERCGLCSVSILRNNDDNYLIFVGSESGRLSVLNCCSKQQSLHQIDVATAACTEWHASTVTAIQTRHIVHLQSSKVLVASVSLDCRLCIGHFEVTANNLTFQRQIPLTISDPTALLLLPTPTGPESNDDDDQEVIIEHSIHCLVSGAGLECIHIC